MNKTIFTVLLFCFAVFSVSAQVESTKADSPQKAVERSKQIQEKQKQERAVQQNQTNAQTNNPNAPAIEFDKMVHDYGTIVQGADGKCVFTFTNTGKEPLILSNVRSS